ncbi:hypothetical protein [Pontibacter sp. G13]|uniref:hypothetical protein n=1 Tax=Pontibacter sp. G13 TaxID=3074898 RepID=UPI0028896C01|nr:hypothetical protein [Pontibacter sp. G13]WNJ17151.1 hypothetical protein RJD25_20030 [Pontibacter sp. G13]
MEYEEELQHEFHAEKGSFLLQLRIDLFWDHKQLIKILRLMEKCCLDMQENSSLPRNWTDGFWYFSTFVEGWSTHPNFPKTYSKKYYEKAYELIFSMSSWFFTGRYPWNIKEGFDNAVMNLERLGDRKFNRFSEEDDLPF